MPTSCNWTFSAWSRVGSFSETLKLGNNAMKTVHAFNVACTVPTQACWYDFSRESTKAMCTTTGNPLRACRVKPIRTTPKCRWVNPCCCQRHGRCSRMLREMNCSSSVARTWQDENLLAWTYSKTRLFEDDSRMSSRTPFMEKVLGFFAKYSYGLTRGRVVSRCWSPGIYSTSYMSLY